jgi:FkbM family methyltransferase
MQAAIGHSVPRVIDVRIGARTYRIASDDNYLEHIKDGFEPDMVRLFTHLIPEGALVYDVGANIGCTALLFASLASRVVAFEPSPSTFSFLARNVSESGLRNIELRNFGLGAVSEELELTFAPSNRSGGFVSNQTKTGAGHVTERIVVKTLDDVVAREAPDRLDFVKIDVEGFEQSVIRGGREAFARFRPVVVLELNHWCLNALQRICVPDFLDFLRSVFPILLALEGDHVVNLHDVHGNYHVMYEHINNNKYRNLVAAFDGGQIARFRTAYQVSLPTPP